MDTDDTCPDCIRLWDEFTKATAVYVDLLKKQEAAVGPEQAAEAGRQLDTAMSRRDTTRTAFRRHVITTHLGQTLSAAS